MARMEWLLIVVLISPADDIKYELVHFATQAECRAGATAFVEKYPAFEFRDRADGRAVENPVLRSYVECAPASGNRP